jgi:hypothetical protein
MKSFSLWICLEDWLLTVRKFILDAMRNGGDRCLYSVGDGVVLQHDMCNATKQAVNVDTIISSTNRETLEVCYWPGV